jgi:hypothetical protein
MENNENNENTNEQRRLENIQRLNEIVEQRRNSNQPLTIPINFDGADLRGINLNGADLRGANLRDANFTRSVLTNCNFTDAHLEEADFTRAILSNSIFTNTFLFEADFFEAVITEAIFTNADIRGTIFLGANFDEAINLVILNDDYMGYIADWDEQLNLIQPNQGQPPRGLAFEIHEKFAKILSKQNEYLAIIKFDQPPIDMERIYRHIQITFQTLIYYLFPGDNEKLNQFNTAFERINNRIPENLKPLILDTIDFVFSQDEDFIIEYIKIFLDESCRAYTGPNPLDNLSCVNGIIERFVTAVGGAVQVLCVSGCENETYQKLDKLFNPKFNIAETANEWWTNMAETAEIQDLTKEQRKEDFKNYLRNKARELDNYNNEIEQQIIDYANEIDYSFENLTLGGRRKTKKTMKTRKPKKTVKSKKPKKSKKVKTRKPRK